MQYPRIVVSIKKYNIRRRSVKIWHPVHVLPFKRRRVPSDLQTLFPPFCCLQECCRTSSHHAAAAQKELANSGKGMLIIFSCALFLTSRCRIVMWTLDQAWSATSKDLRIISLGLRSTMGLNTILISRCLSLSGSFSVLFADGRYWRN